ncbi:MAG: hypothetical protein EBZ48_01685 [Proteobacteria bacterium]|nr:hypothetical protein [Pseudomonadota bacterium]
MGNNNLKALIVVLLAVGHVINCAAAQPLYWEANSGGSDLVIPLDPGMAGKTISVYAVGASASFQSADIAVRGSGGEHIRVDGFAVSSNETALDGISQGSNPLSLWFFESSAAERLVPGRDTPRDPTCGCLSEAQKVNLLAILRQQDNAAWTSDRLCQVVGTPAGGRCDGAAEPNQFDRLASTVFATAFVPVNRCVSSYRPGVVVHIDLTNIPTASLQSGQVTVAIRIRRFLGQSKTNWATFKISDGKKFPGWIALTERVGHGSERDQMRFVSWAGGGRGRIPARVRAASRRGDILYYSGRRFNRTPIGALLTGGKGTVEVSRYGEGYGFCANFTTHARQNFNGYRKGG